ncbi:U32 family peptidase [Eleftheria terrae]|uniref:U32 family peptidase n=1 Tax=Eleftheria terrae TaxID=1597781 RepID=UPI00263A4C12|nr:U32 family peptidase [Eleftheria terrae]WKB54807.1 U32 family peptidase [Eleftheria terrae]
MTPRQQAPRLSLTVGPVLYYWPRNSLVAFYADIADSPADTVVLGEVVCSRRHEMKPDDWLDLARDLRSAGKEVVLASQALLESEAELRATRRLAAQDDFLVEAGDASALRALAGRPFVLGPHINIYSHPALREYAQLGAVRWVAPVELSLESLALINPPGALAVETECFGFGRLPLAFSARCFTARHYRLSKDECAFRCIEHPDGLLLSSTEGEPFLALNGIQSLSAAQHCLLGDGPALRAAGVTRLRLSPCAQGFGQVLDCFDRVLNRGEPLAPALETLDALALPGGLVNGYAHRRPGLEWSQRTDHAEAAL